MSEPLRPAEPSDPAHDRAAGRGAQESDDVQAQLVAFGRLAAGTAHDLNNALTVIVLHARIGLLQSDLSPTLRECLTTILLQSQAAGELVQQVLNYRRGAEMERRSLRLGPFVAEQVRLLSRTLPENIALHFEDEAAAYIINASPAQLQQVIVNLALNARDAMSDGGELRFTLDSFTVSDGGAVAPAHAPPDLAPGSWVRLRVTDTGSGIAPHLLPQLFEPFFTTKAHSGTGLGLMQVQDVVRRHAGRIEVASEVGRGATFALYFPAAPEVKKEPAAADSLPLGHGETVLVVDDDSSIRLALLISLEQLGYQPLAARNGREALSLLLPGTNEIAAVLSDMTMPDMGGAALLEAMHEHKLATPLVFLSGRSLDEDALSAAGQYAGALQKPVQLDALAQMLAHVLASRT